MAKFKRMLAMFLVMVMLVSALPMQVLAADETVIENETVVDGNVKTEIQTQTTTSTDEATGKVTVEVKFTESTTGTNDAGAKVEGQASGESKTVSDSEGNVVESSSSSESSTTTSKETTNDKGETAMEETRVDSKSESSEKTGEGSSSSSSTTTTNTTTVAPNGTATQQTVIEGSSKEESWTNDLKPGTEVPPVEVPLNPGKENKVNVTETSDPDVTGDKPTSPDDKEYNYTETTTTIDRTVIAEVSTPTVTIKDSNTGLVEDKTIELVGRNPVYDVIDGVKQDKGGMFDSQYNSGLTSKYANPDNWTGENSMPEDADVRFVGTGEHTTYYAAIAYVIYEKDADGNTVFDENGKPVIKELWRYNPSTHNPYAPNAKNQQLTLNGENSTELPDDVYGLPEYDNSKGTGGNRPSLHAMVDEYGNTLYGYCIDNMVDTTNGEWYKMSNLEDSDYYASEDAENHIRNIVLNGYWGTSNIAKEDGTYEEGSIESIKQKLLKAVNDGKLDAQVKIYEYKNGQHVYDENGEPKYTLKSAEEVLNGLTAGEAMIATQAAIWSYANGSIAAQNGQDGYLILDPDEYANHLSGSSKGDQDILDGNGGARIDMLYNWLISLDDPQESTKIINDKNFIKDMHLTVGDKVADSELNTDEDRDNDVYNTSLNFTLAFVPDQDSDDLLVYLADSEGNLIADKDGNPIVRRLAGTNSEDRNYDSILPDENGVYTLTGLQLSENSPFSFDLRLEGTQYLENGVYIFESVNGRNASQNFVGVAEGEKNIDVSVGMTIKFDVDENKKVVVEHKWRSETDPVVTPPELEEEPEEEPEENEDTPANWIPPQNNRLANDTVEIADEPVPLAAPVKTGDNTVTWIAFALMIACCMIAINVYDKKRTSEMS